MARILALVTDGFGSAGGIGRYNCDLLIALSRSTAVDHVTVLPRFGDRARSPAALPVKVNQLPPQPRRVGWSARAARLALGGRYDAIFCGHLNAVPLAAALAWASGARLWLQVHGVEAWTPRGRLWRCSVSTARLVTSVSRATRRRLLGWADLTPERVRVLPNTVGEEFAPRHRRADLVQRYGLAGRKVIITVGRLAVKERYKGHDRVIHALPCVAAAIPNVVYLIVGSGDDRTRLEALAREIGVAERVVFAGQVSGDDLMDYFALADVYAMPSTGEGFGIVFLEAAASGLPVIAGNRDGSVDALADGAIGRLIDPLDQRAIEEALIVALRLPQNPPAYDGRQTTVERFRFGPFAEKVDKLVREIVAA